MTTFSYDEVHETYVRWRKLVDDRDLDNMHEMLTEYAIGGNSILGMFEGRDAIIQFSRDRWPELIANRNIWYAIDGNRAVDKWQETLPGTPPEDSEPYTYDGISEFVYAGNGQWRLMYGIPDVVALGKTYKRWAKDGQMKIFGNIFDYDF